MLETSRVWVFFFFFVISVSEGILLVRNLHSGQAAGVHDLQSEILNALPKFGLPLCL